MMTSAEIRQSFLEFFREKQHTVVPSSSLLPDAPNLLFTNAGMNRFVPYFLGQQKCPYKPARTADTQKCIRAGGKHNDLEDVGLDTYHHTFFEMLGNWSFGDYFKREAIDWAWELLVDRWKFPKERLYATYFGGDEKTPADNEARDFWLRYLPADRVLPFGRKDNFWMMGDTGPCGPCSEIHIDLRPDIGPVPPGSNLVNAGTAQCIEIWNLVFIQFNANPDGTYTPLPAKHVDTGMGFERVCSIIQCTEGLKDFSRRISNYETDVFAPLFRELEQLSGKKYGSTLPAGGKEASEQEKADIAFRVIADHVRCLSFAIADGIIPSNEGRGYVLRRILRRAVRYGRNLGFHEPFFYKLVDVVAAEFGDAFPEVRKNRERIQHALKAEEESFNRTLDRGIEIFEEVIGQLSQQAGTPVPPKASVAQASLPVQKVFPAEEAFKLYDTYGFPLDLTELMARERGLTVDVPGFEKLMEEQRKRAREDYEKKKSTITVVGEGLQVEPTKFLGFDNLEAEAVVEAVVPVAAALRAADAPHRGAATPEEFEIILNQTPFYAEMGGQVGDTGIVHVPGHEWTEIGRLQVTDTQRQGEVHVHRCRLLPRPQAGTPVPPGQRSETQAGTPVPPAARDMGKRGMVEQASVPVGTWRAPELGEAVRVSVDAERRAHIQQHHTVTHLFHWALHEIVSRDARQRGSLVAPDRMRFDFNHPEKLTDAQLADIERLVNERIKENAPVHWFEVAYNDIKGNPQVMQFFGEKYGDIVRVVQIGGHAGKLDGYSMELCGGTHTKTTGEIGLFTIARESAIAAGVRRIEALCGRFAQEHIEKSKSQEQAEAEKARVKELEREQAKQRQAELQKQAPAIAEQLLARKTGIGGAGVPASDLIVADIGEASAEYLRAVVDALKPKITSGIVVLGGVETQAGTPVPPVQRSETQAGTPVPPGESVGPQAGTPVPPKVEKGAVVGQASVPVGKVHLICYVTPDLVKKGKHAGKIVGELARICGGGGGGKPDLAQAGGKQPEKLGEALEVARRLV